MKEVGDLTREQLIRIVGQIQDELFLDEDEEGNEVWDPDKQVGADFIDAVCMILERFDLTPKEVGPPFRGVREAGRAEELARLLRRVKETGKEGRLDELVLEVRGCEAHSIRGLSAF